MDNYRKYARRQALGFCCSREHAEDMAKFFCENGINAAAVYSGDRGAYARERNVAINELKNGQLDIIFSVDMFNEGVDIKGLDMVMFLRPTESPIVFLQQLGRGLRIEHGKDYLVVLDFIGNYVNADRIQKYLTSDYQNGKEPRQNNGYHVSNESPYPDGCWVDFDVRLIKMLERLQQRSQTYADIVNEEFQRICDELEGRHPTRLELFNQMSGEIYSICKTKVRPNPFSDYLMYIKQNHSLTPDEQAILDSYGKEFLNWLENTNMTKVYKMPVLESFLLNGIVKGAVSKKEVLEHWKIFFKHNQNWRDLSGVNSFNDYENLTDNWHLRKIVDMPIKFLKKSGLGYVKDQPVTEEIILEFDDKVQKILGLPGMYEQVKDILAYRVQDYYWQRYKKKKI